ncbi:MAG TPA: hypothetical protein VIH90_02785 [Candidatus Saccharimonadales bacterium]
MANRIFYNPEGYIEATIEGEQSYMSFANLGPTALDIIEDLQKKGKKRLGLIDITKQTNFSPDSNRAAMEILESFNYEKLAVFGAGRILTEVTKAIILAMGKNDNTKVFSDRESAVAWLLKE